jgi:protein translocase SecG subunit
MLAALTWLQLFITVIFTAVCVLLIVVVLLQKGRGGGLSGAFGGVGGHSAFGAKTGDVFTWVTVGLTFMFILIAVIGNYKFVPQPAASPQTPVIESLDGGAAPPVTPDES